MAEKVPPRQRFQETDPRKLKKEPVQPKTSSSWNAGFKRQAQPKGTYVKRQIDSMGRESTEHAKIPVEEKPEPKPKEDIERERFEQQRRFGKQSMGLKGKPKDEPVQLNKNIGNFIDNISLVVTDGSEEEVNESAANLKEILEKYGHNSLSALIASNPTRENFKTAITAINKRRGIAETKGPRLPDLVPSRLTRKDGVTQTVYHLPTVGKKKLKIRPGFSKETLVREHGHEGFEGQKVVQTMWKKDKDFTKKGIISMGDWEYNPDKEISSIKKVEYDESEKGIPSAILNYGDGNNAYIKHDNEQKLRREYGVSKFFNNSSLVDSLGFSIPRSNIIDVGKLGNEEIAKSVGAKEGQVIHNEFVDGYPLSLFEGTEIIDKVDKQSLSDAVIFNKLIGNDSFDLSNMLMDDAGNLVLVDNINTLNNALDSDSETYELAFKEWELVDEELMKNSLDKIQEIGFEDFVTGLLQNTQIDDSEFDKYAEVLRQNFELMNAHLYGTPEEIEALQTWWDEEREGRIQLEAEQEQDEQRTTLRELQEDELKSAFMDTIQGKNDRVDEIMVALEEKVRDRLSEEIKDQVKKDLLDELKEQYNLVPKDKDVVEDTTPEHTMEDLFLVNQQRREAGLNPFSSIEEMGEAEKAPDENEVEEPAKNIKDFKWKFTPSEHSLFLDIDEENDSSRLKIMNKMDKLVPLSEVEMGKNGIYTQDDSAAFLLATLLYADDGISIQRAAAKAFNLNPENTTKENYYSYEEPQNNSIKELKEVYKLTQDYMNKKFPDGFIHLYRTVKSKQLQDNGVGSKVNLKTYNISNWTSSAEVSEDIEDAYGSGFVTVMAKIPIDKVLLHNEIISAESPGENWKEINLIGESFDGVIINKDEYSKGEEYYDMEDEERIEHDKKMLEEKEPDKKVKQTNQIFDKAKEINEDGFKITDKMTKMKKPPKEFINLYKQEIIDNFVKRNGKEPTNEQFNPIIKDIWGDRLLYKKFTEDPDSTDLELGKNLSTFNWNSWRDIVDEFDGEEYFDEMIDTLSVREDEEYEKATQVKDKFIIDIAEKMNKTQYEDLVTIENNEILFEKGGMEKDRFTVTWEERDNIYDTVAIHSHPTNTGFSRGDIEFASSNNLKEFKIVSDDYIYTIIRPENGWDHDWYSNIFGKRGNIIYDVAEDVAAEVLMEEEGFDIEEAYMHNSISTMKMLKKEFGIDYTIEKLPKGE